MIQPAFAVPQHFVATHRRRIDLFDACSATGAAAGLCVGLEIPRTASKPDTACTATAEASPGAQEETMKTRHVACAAALFAVGGLLPGSAVAQGKAGAITVAMP